MALLKTYSPKDVEIQFDGTPINSGIGADTFLTVTRAEDAFTAYSGADGTIARTRNANKMGTIELTLMQNSEVNKALMAKAYLDELGAEIIDTISIHDPSDPTKSFMLVANKAWIRKIPDISYAKDYGTVTWTFDVAYLSISNLVTLDI